MLVNYKLIILSLFCFFFWHTSFGITSSTQTGDWSDSGIWDNGVPICGDTIYISTGHTVNITTNLDFSTCGSAMFLVVEGTLDFKNGRKMYLPCGSGVLVKPGGKIIDNGGGGSSNSIDICGVSWWQSGDGSIKTPTSLGTLFSEKIISVASTAWELASTWNCNCKPQFYHDVIIDSAHAVSLNSTPIVNSLQIYGTFDAALSSNTLSLTGNWNNNGVFNQGNTTINLNGTTLQQISGNTNFNNLIIDNINGAQISTGTINLIGSLTLTNGNFATSNLLTIISDANGTGRIAQITGGSISGNITMQRYVNAGSTNWRFLTSAISGTTIADFNDDFITSGFTGSDFPFWPTAANPWASIYYYDETQPGIQDSGFVAATNVTNSLAPGEGLWIWCGDTITGTQPFTIDITGPPNTGIINKSLSYTNTGFLADDGWNMSGNPYPSTIDWDTGINKTGINGAIYIWDPDAQQFASYISPFGTNGGSKNIASSQAFWVQANATGANLQFTESSKTTNGGTFFKQSNPSPLTINVANSYGTDQTIINFEANATIGFDGNYDALKLTSWSSNVPSISTIMMDSINFSINQFPEQEIDIPLKITTGASGLHQIDFTGISNFSNSACLILEDLFTGSSYDLNTTSSITAYIYDTTTTARFLIKFGARVDITSNDISCYGNNDGDILFEKNSPNPFDVVWKDNLGNIINNNTNVNISDGISNLTAGTYTIETTDITCGNRTDVVLITEPNQITAQFSTSSDTVYLSGGGNITFANQSLNANYYDWNFGDLSTDTLPSPSHQYSQSGIYSVLLNAYQNVNCYQTTSKSVTVLNTITSIDEVEKLNEANVWINTHRLFIDGENISNIEIRNIIGQLLPIKTTKKDYQVINLENLSSQILVITITSNNKASSTKVSYIKN